MQLMEAASRLFRYRDGAYRGAVANAILDLDSDSAAALAVLLDKQQEDALEAALERRAAADTRAAAERVAAAEGAAAGGGAGGDPEEAFVKGMRSLMLSPFTPIKDVWSVLTAANNVMALGPKGWEDDDTRSLLKDRGTAHRHVD